MVDDESDFPNLQGGTTENHGFVGMIMTTLILLYTLL